MAKSIEDGQMLYKYYIEDDQLKVIEGVFINRAGRKYIAFDSRDVPDEGFPGYKNIGRVWANGKVLYLPGRDDELAKKLYTEYCVNAIKDLQMQIDDMGDRIAMIRKIKLGTGSARRSKCFGEIEAKTFTSIEEWRRQSQEPWDCSEFVNPKQYVERKIAMLKQEMFINLSPADELHLRSLTSRGAIDACVRAMINKYWE
jgi:hypothetical protein